MKDKKIPVVITGVVAVLSLVIGGLVLSQDDTIPAGDIVYAQAQTVPTHATTLQASHVTQNETSLVTESNETIDRGFHVIDGNIYDRYGQILIEIDDYGFTSNLFRISPYFSVIYGGTPYTRPIEKYPNVIDRANGTWVLPENGIVTERVGPHSTREFISMQIGTRGFSITPEHPRLLLGFLEGDMPYVDFIIVNNTRNLEEVRIVSLPVGHVQYFDFAFETALSTPDRFDVRVIPREGYGEARLLVQQVKR